MSNTLSKRDITVNRNLTKCDNKWDRAIQDAKRNIARLESAIKTYEERKAAGEPWPGDVAGTKKESVPA